jgi:hypothetical protein
MTSMRMPWAIVGAAYNQGELQAAMEGLVIANEAQLETGGIPPLYHSGVVYERETRSRHPVGVERFQTARDAFKLGHADCDGLAPWRVAELRREGEDARVRVVRSPNVGYHVVVVREDGRIEDPSAKLGMLDGVGVGDDPRQSARSRRRRRMGALKAKLQRLAQEAQRVSASSPYGMAIRAALSEGTAQLRGLQAQDAADRGSGLSSTDDEGEDE